MGMFDSGIMIDTPEGREDFFMNCLDILAGRVAIDFDICGEKLKKLITDGYAKARAAKKRNPSMIEIKEAVEEILGAKIPE